MTTRLIRNRLTSCVRKFIFLCMGLVVLPVLSSTVAYSADWASVIMYHRFGEDQHRPTNIRIDQFEEHIKELSSGGYTVLPLNEIVDRLEKGEELPDRTVAITIDDAYRSVYEVAWPRLKAAGLPFTIFVATEGVDKGYSDFMNWDQLRELSAAGVHIGHHTVTHAHLPTLSVDRVQKEIEDANGRFEAELGFIPAIFAYPYGEYGDEIKSVVKRMGFNAAFGQQSGVAYSGYDRYELPRFAMTESYGGIGRFKLAANALPLRVKDVTPSNNVLRKNPPNFGFTITEDYGNLKPLSCFASSQTGGAVPIELIGESRVEVRMTTAFKSGRGRINCTLPGPDRRWRWFGSLFYIPATIGR